MSILEIKNKLMKSIKQQQGEVSVKRITGLNHRRASLRRSISSDSLPSINKSQASFDELSLSSGKFSQKLSSSSEREVPPRPSQSSDLEEHPPFGKDSPRHKRSLPSLDTPSENNVSHNDTSSIHSDKPELLPRAKQPENNIPNSSKLMQLDYTKDRADGYSYVISRQFDKSRNPVEEEEQHEYQ